MTYQGDIQERLDPDYFLTLRDSDFQAIRSSVFPVKKLGNLSTLVTKGETPLWRGDPFQREGIPFLRVQNIKGEINFDDVVYISKDVHERMKRSTLNDDCLLLTIAGTLGNVAFFKREYPECNINQAIAKIRLTDEISYEYAVIYFQTKLARSQINILSTYTARGNLNFNQVRSFDVIVPPPDIQNHIVEIMHSAYAQKKQKEQEADALLDSIDDYVLAELGIEMPAIEKKKCFVVRWDAVNDRLDPHFYHPRFEKLLAVLHQGPHEILGNITKLCHQKWKPEEHQEEMFRYIEFNGVSRDTGEVSFSEVPTKEAPNRAQMMVQKDDIIVSLTRPHHGSIALIDDDLDGCIISTGFAVLREIKDPTLSRLYLHSVLRNKLCLHQMLQRSSGGNYPAITKDQLMQILLPIPSPNRQKEIVKELSRRSDKAHRLREEATKEWEAAKAQLEEQLLTGEVF